MDDATDAPGPRTAAATADARTRFPWLPPQARNSALVYAGDYWDAIRVPRIWGDPVVKQLGDHNGAIIADWEALYWLIPTGGADRWDLPLGRGVRICGRGVWVGVPGLLCEGIPRWEIRPDAVDDWRTSPGLLYRALTAVLRGDG